MQKVLQNLSHSSERTWEIALLELLETYHITIHNVNPINNIESFLDNASGFLSANSFSGCHPPRTIRICTTSNIENAKCGWIREAAAVQGIEPDIDCVRAENTTDCMQAVQDNAADLVMVPPNLMHKALR